MKENLPQSVSEMKDILPIEGYVEISRSYPWWAIALSVIVSFLFVFLVLKICRKYLLSRKKILINPDQKALLEISKLNTSEEFSNQQWDLYYFKLTEIFKKYCQDHLNIPVLDKTDEEILGHMQYFDSICNNDQKKTLSRLLKKGEVVKFAKESAVKEEAVFDLKFIEDLILKSRKRKVK